MFCDRHRLMPKNSRNAPKRQTRIFYRNLQCFEPSQGRCEQSLYRAQGHFCWYLRCFLRILAAHNGPFLGQNGPANLKFGTAPPPRPPPPKRSMPTTPSATALSVKKPSSLNGFIELTKAINFWWIHGVCCYKVWDLNIPKQKNMDQNQNE